MVFYAENTVMVVPIAEGQLSEAVLVVLVQLNAYTSAGRIDEVVEDKGFDSKEIREVYLRLRGTGRFVLLAAIQFVDFIPAN